MYEHNSTMLKNINQPKETMKQENKIPFNKVYQSILQDIAGNLVSNNVYVCQSHLVSKLFEKEVIHLDDYENFYLSDKKIKEHHNIKTKKEIQEIKDNGEDMQEVFEHWLVSDWLLNKLEKLEEPILKTDLETWWGRTCTGQAICLDYNIQALAYEYSYDNRLFKQEKVA